MSYIAVFGPPGAGKSTVIHAAQAQGIAALDLEDYASHEERVAAARDFAATHERGLLGAADVAPEEFPAGTACVLLLPAEETLRARVIGRGDERAHKWLEHALKVRGEHAAMARAGMFIAVYEDDVAPEVIVDRMAALCGLR